MSTQSVLSFDEVQAYLDQLCDEMPTAYLQSLNGGVILVPDTLPSPHGLRGDLFTLGMYHYEPYGMGRYITIYYGSFVTLYGHQPTQTQHQALRDVLHHELTHHLESLAGDRSLEKEDEDFLRKYRSGEKTDRHNH